MAEKKPRGVRNHNPGNIVFNPANKWQGQIGKESPPPNGEPARFARFTNPVYGIRAIARTLITYQDKYDLRTVDSLISRWAPSIENDTHAYAQAVAKHMRVLAHDTVNMHDYNQLRPMVEAIITHENARPGKGDTWKTWYTDAQLTKALVMSGVEPAKKPVAETRTAKGAATVLTVGGGMTIEGVANAFEAVSPAFPLAEALAQNAPWILCGLILLAAAGYILYARIQDRKRGLR